MKTIFLGMTILMVSLANSSNAQSTRVPSTTPDASMSSNKIEVSEQPESQSGVIQTKEKSKDLPDPNNRVNKTSDIKSDGTTAQPSVMVPATRTTEKNEITSINYSLQNNNSALTNLLNLIEIKEKVNDSNNDALKQSLEYQQLLSDITSLRSDFDNQVESKGIENCSTTEQSYYLAFLKEEGNEKAYTKAMNKLK